MSYKDKKALQKITGGKEIVLNNLNFRDNAEKIFKILSDWETMPTAEMLDRFYDGKMTSISPCLNIFNYYHIISYINIVHKWRN